MFCGFDCKGLVFWFICCIFNEKTFVWENLACFDFVVPMTSYKSHFLHFRIVSVVLLIARFTLKFNRFPKVIKIFHLFRWLFWIKRPQSLMTIRIFIRCASLKRKRCQRYLFLNWKIDIHPYTILRVQVRSLVFLLVYSGLYKSINIFSYLLYSSLRITFSTAINKDRASIQTAILVLMFETSVFSLIGNEIPQEHSSHRHFL